MRKIPEWETTSTSEDGRYKIQIRNVDGKLKSMEVRGVKDGEPCDDVDEVCLACHASELDEIIEDAAAMGELNG